MTQHINKETYVGDTGKQLKDITKIQEQNMNVISEMSDGKWVKICNIKHSNHYQGEFSFIKIFIGDGNNGRTNQNAYIDLVCQMGWTGSDSGRYGCNAELHGFLTGFTINNTKIKVLANSNIDYDVWFYSNRSYNRINYIINTSKNTIVTTKGELSSTEPTGTECNLSYIGDKNSSILLGKSDEPINWSAFDTWSKMPYTVELQKYGNNVFKSTSNGDLIVNKDIQCLYISTCITFDWNNGGTNYMFARICKNGTPITKTITTLHRWGHMKLDAIIPVSENDKITVEVYKDISGTVCFYDYTASFGQGRGCYVLAEVLK